jgi:hypothetical protein
MPVRCWQDQVAQKLVPGCKDELRLQRNDSEAYIFPKAAMVSSRSVQVLETVEAVVL